MDRRSFLGRGLGGALALGCSAAASPLLTPVSLASAPGENRLVVIVLRGAMDGLGAVEPVGLPGWAALRPTLAAGPEGRIAAGGPFALHPALTPLEGLWRAGELGAVHAVATPYRDRRSHFDGQDILELGSGTLDQGLRDGWLNRLVGLLPGAVAETAYAVGLERMLILSGATPVASWSPGTRLSVSPATEQLLEAVLHDDPLFRDAFAGASVLSQTLQRERPEADSTHERVADFAARRLREEARIASFSLGGWDTHAGQAQSLGRALGALAATILALRDGLGPLWDRTAVLCVTEFGRTVRENGTAGTDHGTGGAILAAGGAIRGGRVLGDWPGVGEGDLYAGRDLLPTRDLRAVAGWAVRGMFGLPASEIERVVFPGADLGRDPGLLA